MTDVSPVRIEVNGPQWLVVAMDVPGAPPEDLLRWFLEPELLARWWSPAAVVEAWPGGRWEMGFPQVGATLTGQVADLTSTSLVVSWAWDNEPDLPARSLIIRAEPAGDGARVRLVQGPYRPGPAFLREDEDRESHVGGWEYFLSRLVDAIS